MKPLGFYDLTFTELAELLNLPEDVKINNIIIPGDRIGTCRILLSGENEGLPLVQEGFVIPNVKVCRKAWIER